MLSEAFPSYWSSAADIQEVAEPNCLLLNYANPNAMITWACNTYGQVRTVGLCHGVQAGHQMIAEVLGLKQEEVDIICVGINHQTWYIKGPAQRRGPHGQTAGSLREPPQVQPHGKSAD